MRDFTFKETDRPTLPEFNRRFSEIGSVLGGLGNEYVWERYGTIPAHYAVENAGRVTIQQTNTATTYYIGDAVTVDSAGKVSIVNERQVTVSWSNRNDLQGKYLRNNAGYLDANLVYYAPANAIFYDEFGYPNIMYANDLSKVVGYAESLGLVGYVNSSDPNAYPVNDGYTYTPLGMLGDKTRIETGSYVGTGTYGASNPNSITFSFTPKLWGIYRLASSTGSNSVTFYAPWGLVRQSGAAGLNQNNDITLFVSYSGNTVSWYDVNSAPNQLNMNKYTYYYIAIG